MSSSQFHHFDANATLRVAFILDGDALIELMEVKSN